jgi:phage baseplate assembly protein W
MNLEYPYQFDHRGRTAESTYPDHIRDMIEQVLFTSPNERVNRPDFGCGLLQLVHEPNSSELAESLQLTVSGALDQWLGDVIEVMDLRVESADSTIRVELAYQIRASGDKRFDDFVFQH